MLDELCPIQFVEGLNEGAVSVGGDLIAFTDYSGIGIQYIPQVSYILTKLEVVLIFAALTEESLFTIKLCSAYDDKPTDIVLASGSFAPTKSGLWQEVTLKPTSVIRNRKYWVTIHHNGFQAGLSTAEKGKGLVMSTKKVTRWEALPTNIEGNKVMLRFYGRILPINT